MSYTKQHNSEIIKREISAIIRELKDPRLTEGFISIAKIELTKKNSSCRVFVSALEGHEFAVRAVDRLKSAAGYIRKKLGEKISVRYLPTLVFIPTDSVEYGANILKKLNDIQNKRKSEKKSVKSLSEVAEVIRTMNNIHIVTHIYPDGDAIGSSFALCKTLQKLNKNCTVVLGRDVPKKLKFLTDCVSISDFELDYVISVDLPDTSRLDTNNESYSQKIDVSIDHHISNKNFAKINYVDSNASATCEIIYELLEYLKVDLDEDICKLLYLGISSDTGCFKHSNTTYKSHKIVSEIMKQNIDISEINERLFLKKSKEKLEIEKIINNNFEYYFNNQCAITFITLDDMKKCGINEDECEGIASIPISIEGVTIGIILREKSENNYKASVRTSGNQDANKISSLFGGGGHIKAAGFNIDGSIDEVKNLIIKTIQTELDL